MFGALKPCKECDGGQFVFRSGVGYQCSGNVSEWTKCQNKSNAPERIEFKLPKDFKARYDFCKLYKCKIKERIIPNNPSTVKPVSSKESSTDSLSG